MRTDKKAVAKSQGEERLARRLQSENPGLESYIHTPRNRCGNSAHYRGRCGQTVIHTGAAV